MYDEQLTLDFAPQAAIDPDIPAGWRRLGHDEPKAEGDMFWSGYVSRYIPESSPWETIARITEFNGGAPGEDIVIRQVIAGDE